MGGVATYLSTGGRGKKQKARLSKRRMRGSRHQCLFEENVRKTKRKSANFENKSSRVVYAQEGYQHPTCSSQGTTAFNQVFNVTSKNYLLFPFLYLFIFEVDNGMPLLLCILKCDEKFKLTWFFKSENVCGSNFFFMLLKDSFLINKKNKGR